MMQESLTALGALKNTQRFKWLIPQRAREHKQNAVAVARDDGEPDGNQVEKKTLKQSLSHHYTLVHLYRQIFIFSASFTIFNLAINMLTLKWLKMVIFFNQINII